MLRVFILLFIIIVAVFGEETSNQTDSNTDNSHSNARQCYSCTDELGSKCAKGDPDYLTTVVIKKTCEAHEQACTYGKTADKNGIKATRGCGSQIVAQCLENVSKECWPSDGDSSEKINKCAIDGGYVGSVLPMKGRASEGSEKSGGIAHCYCTTDLCNGKEITGGGTDTHKATHFFLIGLLLFYWVAVPLLGLL